MKRWELNCSSEDGEQRPGLIGAATVEVEATAMELVAAEEGSKSPGSVRMKCVPYGEPGPHWRGFVQFAPGSFTDSLASIVGKDTKAYIAADAHRLNPTDLLANSLSNAPRGTVTYEDTTDGLYATVVLPNTNAGRDVAELVDIGTIDSCSIGVLIEKYESERAADSEEDEIMTITQAVNRETSLVARPRFESAEVKKLRSDDDDIGEVTASLFDAFSNKVDEAVKLIAALVAAQQPEPEEEEAEPEEEAEESKLDNAEREADNGLPLSVRLTRASEREA